ncbi:Stringent starvation protein B [Thalassovita autumnalis]|uniref:Stringent starvation protein B n=1 Tax=Thalassovita autumnalis TaxID=2072972 RepID=A0A0N7LVN2_9RHOB|nr:ClpXP protease specificity-enhancing factor SspB [Thalassovita autumnalis]CUH66770.1 Stringent starvation protein B [Thalassovita autumnalis]CUH71501.1 Stringent starvation protein B [Thalassovita autumnalis]
MSSSIDYGNLMHRAMRSLIQEVLQGVAENGLPGAHHFFITFDTTHPDAVLASWLKERYPSEMTVVMQHWYDNLLVEEDGFHVTLNFGDQPEPLYVPFDSICTFVDPSVEFGLRFETPEDGDEDGEGFTEQDGTAALEEILEEKSAPQEAEVVSLDSFRK